MTYSYGFTAFRATLGQALINETSTYSHAFIVVANDQIIEPWPSGARLSSLADYEDEDVAYGFRSDLSDSARAALAAAALSLDGVRHGLTDYLALAMHRYGWSNRRATHRLADYRRLLPAQFVVETYRRTGLNILPGTDAGNVTLGDLGALMLTAEEWELRTPCIDFGVHRGRYAY